MNTIQRTKTAVIKLGTLFLVAYIVAFYALPLGFFVSKTVASNFKNKPITEAGYEFSEGFDVVNETQPGTDSKSVFASFATVLACTNAQNKLLTDKCLKLYKRGAAKIFCINCSYIFYG